MCKGNRSVDKIVDLGDLLKFLGENRIFGRC